MGRFHWSLLVLLVLGFASSCQVANISDSQETVLVDAAVELGSDVAETLDTPTPFGIPTTQVNVGSSDRLTR
jgi:hypothetical protein